jgi:hypothetical protein
VFRRCTAIVPSAGTIKLPNDTIMMPWRCLWLCACVFVNSRIFNINKISEVQHRRGTPVLLVPSRSSQCKSKKSSGCGGTCGENSNLPFGRHSLAMSWVQNFHERRAVLCQPGLIVVSRKGIIETVTGCGLWRALHQHNCEGEHRPMP